MLLAAQILLTIATLGYSLIPTYMDFNSSHATNPSWTGHARFHVVTQVIGFDIVAVLSLFLIWSAGGPGIGLWAAAILSLAAYGGFWAAVASRPMYEGVLKDKVNGVPEFDFNIFGWRFSLDSNVAMFAPLSLLTVAAMAIIATLPAGA